MIAFVLLLVAASALGTYISLEGFDRKYCDIEKDIAAREVFLGNALSENFRLINRSKVELRHLEGQLAIKKSKLSPYEILDHCISCGGCKAACPYPIIEEGEPFRIQSEACVGCDLCNKACPVDACRPIYENMDEISIYSDQGVGRNMNPIRESVRKLIDLDLAQQLHADENNKGSASIYLSPYK